MNPLYTHASAGAYYSPATSDVAPALSRLFAASCHGRNEAVEDALHVTAITFVTRLKARGLPPEAVVVALKAALASADASGNAPSLTQTADSRSRGRTASYQRLLTWCLDAYFDER